MILELNSNGPPQQYWEIPKDAQAKLDAGTALYFKFSEVLHTYLMLVGGEWMDIETELVQGQPGYTEKKEIT